MAIGKTRRKKGTRPEARACEKPEGTRACPHCGTALASGAAYCSGCGHAAPEPGESAEVVRRAASKKGAKAAAERAGAPLARCTNDLVAFDNMLENGLAVDGRGRWSRTLEFGDTAYDQERREQRDDIYDKMSHLHAAFPAGVVYQINLLNLPETRSSQARRAQLLPTSGAEDEMAAWYNRLIERKQAEGRTEIRRVNLLTFSVAAPDAAAAENALSTMRDGARAQLDRMQVASRALDGEERLRIFHDLMRGPEAPFAFSFDAEGAGRLARAAVAPDWAVYPEGDMFLRRTLVTPGFLVKTLVVRNFGAELSDGAIKRIRQLPVPMNISLCFEPQPKGEMISRAQHNINVCQGELADIQVRNSRAGIDATLVPPALEDREADGKELRDFLIEDDQQVSWFQGLITIYAKSPAEMRRFTSMVLDEAQVYSLDVRQVAMHQEELWKSAQPAADTWAPRWRRSLTTSEAAIMMPWTAETVFHDPRNSYFFVQHGGTLAPLFVAPRELKSPHMMIFGITGSGKGMLVNTILGHIAASWPRTAEDEATGYLRSEDARAPQVIVFDQHGEYRPLAEKVGAPVYEFCPGGRWRLNPFDLGCATGELTMAEVHKNADFFRSLAQDVMEGALLKKHQSIIDTCLQEIYEPHVGKTTRPTLSDFQRALEGQREDAAAEIALAFRSYSEGLMNAFDGQTNVVDAPHMTFYDCSQLGTSLQTLAMLSAMQHVRNITFKNYRAGRPTIAVFEEFQVLFKNDAAVAMLDAFFGEMRKFGLQLICVTQHPTRVLEHPLAKNLFENTSLLAFLPMQNHNADYVAEEFRLSAAQRDCIDVRSEPGRGLLIADGMKMPFNARIDPKWDAELYGLFNTDPDRVREGRTA